MQTIYEYDFRQASDPETAPKLDDILARNLEVYHDNIEDTDFVRTLVYGTVANYDKIDGLIAPAAPDWPIEQIAKIDRGILRLAIYELMINRDVPPKVAINEAVELAKAFGGDNSSRFVNGVLGTIYRQSEFYEPETDKPTKDSDASVASKPDQPGSASQGKQAPVDQKATDQTSAS